MARFPVSSKTGSPTSHDGRYNSARIHRGSIRGGSGLNSQAAALLRRRMGRSNEVRTPSARRLSGPAEAGTYTPPIPPASADPTEPDVRAPDPFRLNPRARMGCGDHGPASGEDPGVKRGVTGEEEDEVSRAASAPGDVDRGQVLLLGGAGDAPADPGVRVLGQARTVESGLGTRSSVPVGDAYFGMGDTEGMGGDTEGHCRVSSRGRHRVQAQGEAEQRRDQHRGKTAGQDGAKRGGEHGSHQSFEPPTKGDLSGSGRKYPAAILRLHPKRHLWCPVLLGSSVPVTVGKSAMPSARVTGLSDRADRPARMAGTHRPSTGRTVT